MRRKDATTTSIKESIADALIRLMPIKAFEKITIEEITDLAKVGRVTYFRNFSSKMEVITFKLIQLWKQWAKDHGLTEKSRYSLDTAEHFFAFNYSIRDLHRIIYDANLQAAMYDAFYQVMVPPPEEDAVELYKNRFLSYGLFGLLDEWIKRNYRETPKEMADMLTTKLAVMGTA